MTAIPVTHQLIDILAQWQQSPDDNWVLGVITDVQGSSYRKPGAIMLFHPLGKTYGLLSGGCLEGDLRRHAQKVMQTKKVVQLEYDASDESDASYQLGCGGIVNICLLLVSKENDHLGLSALYEGLKHGWVQEYRLPLAAEGSPCDQLKAIVSQQHKDVQRPVWPEKDVLPAKAACIEECGQTSLVIPIRPPIQLGIFGAGLDAQPLAAMAQVLGWRVTLFDYRPAYGRGYDFPGCIVIKDDINALDDPFFNNLDAAVLMSHNLKLDAKALLRLHTLPIRYLALLGPAHRREKVLSLAGCNIADFSGFFSAPAGLALGGELPSSVALSILSQCHGVLHDSALISLDKVML
jgi:xanthine dehydrogenase accessory factor